MGFWVTGGDRKREVGSGDLEAEGCLGNLARCTPDALALQGGEVTIRGGGKPGVIRFEDSLPTGMGRQVAEGLPSRLPTHANEAGNPLGRASRATEKAGWQRRLAPR